NGGLYLGLVIEGEGALAFGVVVSSISQRIVGADKDLKGAVNDMLSASTLISMVAIPISLHTSPGGAPSTKAETAAALSEGMKAAGIAAGSSSTAFLNAG
ncbi:MAG: hypothetical protein L6R35_003298, partial [Caloplaca aegaea]